MTFTAINLPAEFSALEPFQDWALATPDERQAKRRASSSAQLRAFYDAMIPHLEKIVAACDAYPLGTLPEPHCTLFNMALSMAEIAHHIELYRGEVGVPFAFEESRFVARHGRQETWKAEPPGGWSA